MKTGWLEESFTYDGAQLKPLFAYMRTGLLGDSIVAWRGPCDIPPAKMVDGEDLRAKAEIRGSDMIHFIVEKFNCSLLAAVALQRLLASHCEGILRQRVDTKLWNELGSLYREGDDVYIGEKKLSISIASASPTSALIHFAVNALNQGTPVPTISLQELKINPQAFAEDLMVGFAKECDSIVSATEKVFPLMS
jgi:hypothetical protein